MPLPLPSSLLDARRAFLLLSTAAFVAASVAAYQAASNEITGRAIYHRATSSRGSVPVHITRESDPTKFRRATNFRWGVSLACLGVAAVGFTFYRKLDDIV